ncbi:hypothetical protein [Plantactinospora mayteni]|uniref:hypothetical protein n=1 Tax=Plantactinospora mayteni TaxID=566021 RepID=UPI0019420258
MPAEHVGAEDEEDQHGDQTPRWPRRGEVREGFDDEPWAHHGAQTAFPARLMAVDIAGVEMVMLDADAAGCISEPFSS